MKKDGIVAHTAGQSYSLIALSATNNLRRCGVTAPTVGNPRRKIKVLPLWVTNSILAHPFVPGKEIAEALMFPYISAKVMDWYSSYNKCCYRQQGKESLGNFFNRS